MLGEQSLILIAGVLAGRGCVVQELVRWAALKGRHFEGLLGQFVRHVFVHGPTDQASGKQSQHTGQLQPAFIRCNGSDVHQPLPVRCVRRELTA